MPWYDETSIGISDKLRQCVTPSRPKDSMVDDQWALIEPCLCLLPQKRPSASHLLKIIKDYLVSVGPCDPSGQIKRQKDYPTNHGGYGSVYEGIWSRKTGGAVKVLFLVCICR
jgi:serine/threonine protein kinase